MKAILILDITIDGEATKEQVEKAIAKLINEMPQAIDSESIDGTDDYAVLIEQVDWEVKP